MSSLLFQFSIEDNWVSKLDTRSKILFAMNLVLISILVNDLYILTFYLLIILVLLQVNYGLFHFPRMIWYMRYFLILIIVINFLIVQKLSFGLLIVYFKIFILLLSFYLFNKSTDPDLIVDALIKMYVPPIIAWYVGSTLRQAIFLIEDINDVMAIAKIRMKFEQPLSQSKSRLFPKLRENIRLIHPLFVSTFSRAIMNASDMGDTMFIRGWNGAHKEISLRTNNMKIIDITFILLLIILPNMLTLAVFMLKIF